LPARWASPARASQQGVKKAMKVFTGWPGRHTFAPFLIFYALSFNLKK
jgi:hypothetical protein